MKKLLKRLVIDSATKNLYISILEGDECLGDFWEPGHNDHSVKLMSQIEVLMHDNNLKVSDLDEIIVGIGPGSYTGLRIGVVVAKMFGWNNNIPVKTISSLALIASGYDGDEMILPEIDARRGNSFLGLYKNDGKTLKMVEEEQLTNLENYTDTTESKYKKHIKIVSDGKPNMIKILNSELLQLIEDIHTLNPNYLRLTEAERNLK
jgi:tRNA threonylcarbamoyladenosine biosynthesis protein TsaB